MTSRYCSIPSVVIMVCVLSPLVWSADDYGRLASQVEMLEDPVGILREKNQLATENIPLSRVFDNLMGNPYLHSHPVEFSILRDFDLFVRPMREKKSQSSIMLVVLSKRASSDTSEKPNAFQSFVDGLQPGIRVFCRNEDMQSLAAVHVIVGDTISTFEIKELKGRFEWCERED